MSKQIVEGWEMWRDDEVIVVTHAKHGGVEARYDPNNSASEILWRLASDLLDGKYTKAADVTTGAATVAELRAALEQLVDMGVDDDWQRVVSDAVALLARKSCADCRYMTRGVKKCHWAADNTLPLWLARTPLSEFGGNDEANGCECYEERGNEQN